MTVFHSCVILICTTITGFTVSVLAKSLLVGTSNQMFVGSLRTATPLSVGTGSVLNDVGGEMANQYHI